MTAIPNPTGPKGILLLDLNGGEDYIVPCTVGASNTVNTGSNLLVGGLALTTSGVTDSTDKRFITDTQRTALVDYTAAKTALDALIADQTALHALALVEAVLQPIGALTGAETLLATVPGVDLNVDPEQTLYTVPVGKSCIVTKIVVRNASTSLTTASYSIGFNAGTDNNIVANATHTGLDGATKYIVLTPIATGGVRGAAADVLALKNNTKQGGAATVTVDVFGYLY